jgi:hypothetical protein
MFTIKEPGTKYIVYIKKGVKYKNIKMHNSDLYAAH